MTEIRSKLILFGYFDIFILVILIFSNIKFYGKINVKSGCGLSALIFGFLLPLISMLIELEIVKANGGWMDSFEVLYVYLRFPTYWVIGIIQVVILGFSESKKNEFN